MSDGSVTESTDLNHRHANPSRLLVSRRIAGALVPPLVVGLVIVGAWYFVSYAVLDDSRRFLLEPPHLVLRVGFLDYENFSELLSGLWSSTKVALIGLTIAVCIGLLVAILMSQSRQLERGVFPYMVALQAIPILAIVPLISFWWGTGQRSRIFVCVLISVFPIVVNTLFGLKSAERGMHDLFTLHDSDRITRLRMLTFPGALPAIFAGLRIAAGLSVIGAIVGDFFFGRGDVGIGQLIRRYSLELDGELLIAAVMMSSALGIAVFLSFGVLQSLMIGKWHDASGD